MTGRKRKPGIVSAGNAPPLSDKLKRDPVCFRSPQPSDGVDGPVRGLGSPIWARGESALSWLLDLVLVPVKPKSPFSTVLLIHYVEATGKTFELDKIPEDWQRWIVKATEGRIGVHKSLNPYNSGLYDLRNSLGHFDVTVIQNSDGTKTYNISKPYHFGWKQRDRLQQGRHGFPLGKLGETQIAFMKRLLPEGEYWNPGGFHEHWEIAWAGRQIYLYIPQSVLDRHGRAFIVYGSFRWPNQGRSENTTP